MRGHTTYVVDARWHRHLAELSTEGRRQGSGAGEAVHAAVYPGYHGPSKQERDELSKRFTERSRQVVGGVALGQKHHRRHQGAVNDRPTVRAAQASQIQSVGDQSIRAARPDGGLIGNRFAGP